MHGNRMREFSKLCNTSSKTARKTLSDFCYQSVPVYHRRILLFGIVAPNSLRTEQTAFFLPTCSSIKQIHVMQ